MRELTDKQQEVLGFIRTFVAKHGVPPTVREIGGRFKVTPRAAFDHLRALERKGALQRRVSAGRTSRALTLTDPPARATHAVPIPGLEILANDVRCTHGATVGRVDREQLFYLMARGLPRSEAERLIVRGFFQDVLDRIELEPVREAVTAALEARIPQG